MGRYREGKCKHMRKSVQYTRGVARGLTLLEGVVYGWSTGKSYIECPDHGRPVKADRSA